MNKPNFKLLRFPAALLLAFTVLFNFNLPRAAAQLEEPPVRAVDEPETPFGQGFRNRLGASFVLNNFGFGINGIYARAVGPFTEITFTAAITGISDVSAQEFIFFRTGRRVVPNKFKRALGFPLMIGIEQRIFPRSLADNFRLFISADGGAAFAFTYPYFDDENNNGYRDTFRLCRNTIAGRLCNLDFFNDVNDFFSGWGEGDWHMGFAGGLSLGVDLGSDFNSQATFEIGYFFYYFPDGLQIMEPFRRERFIETEQGCPQGFECFVSEGQEPFFDEQNYFGSPVIKFTYSWWL